MDLAVTYPAVRLPGGRRHRREAIRHHRVSTTVLEKRTAVTMSPSVRKLTLAMHLTVSIGWLGAVAAYLALDLTTAMAQDAQTLRAAYVAMATVTRYVIVPLAFASLLTGIVISVATKWGLFRHYWVVISFVVTTIATLVLLVETRTINSLAEIAADPKRSAAEVRMLPSTLAHSVGGTVVLLLILVLNIYKPIGLTRYGLRKQEEQRLKRQEPRNLVAEA